MLLPRRLMSCGARAAVSVSSWRGSLLRPSAEGLLFSRLLQLGTASRLGLEGFGAGPSAEPIFAAHNSKLAVVAPAGHAYALAAFSD